MILGWQVESMPLIREVTTGLNLEHERFRVSHILTHFFASLRVQAGWHAPSVLVSTWSSEAESPNAKSLNSRSEPPTPSRDRQ